VEGHLGRGYESSLTSGLAELVRGKHCYVSRGADGKEHGDISLEYVSLGSRYLRVPVDCRAAEFR
jgi:hypothetical protein